MTIPKATVAGVAMANTASLGQRLWVWYLSLPERRRFLLVTAVAFAAVFARRPERLTQAEFYGEDGSVFYLGTYFGTIPEILFRPYAGYDNLLSRALAFVERAVPVVWAPLVANTGAILMVALLAAFIASSRLRSTIPHPGARLAVALLVVALPNSVETLGVAADLMRYVALFLLAMSVADRPSSTLGRMADISGVVVAGLTGPMGLLLLPLFLVRAWTRRERYSTLLAGALSAASAVQLLTIILSGRHAANLVDMPDLVRAFAFRTTVQAVLGQQWSYVLSNAGIPLIIGAAAVLLIAAAIIVLWWTAVPGRLRWPLAWTFVAVTGSSALAQTEGGAVLLDLVAANRYFVVSTAMVAAVVFCGLLCARSRRIRPLALGMAILLACGLGGDLRMYPFPTYGWPGRAACIGGPAPCDVDVFYPPAWTVHWPGTGGTYVQPRPGA